VAQAVPPAISDLGRVFQQSLQACATWQRMAPPHTVLSKDGDAQSGAGPCPAIGFFQQPLKSEMVARALACE
jgi:hypothetical protein